MSGIDRNAETLFSAHLVRVVGLFNVITPEGKNNRDDEPRSILGPFGTDRARRPIFTEPGINYGFAFEGCRRCVARRRCPANRNAGSDPNSGLALARRCPHCVGGSCRRPRRHLLAASRLIAEASKCPLDSSRGFEWAPLVQSSLQVS